MTTRTINRVVRENELARLVERRLLLPADGPVATELAALGDVHRRLPAALAAGGPDSNRDWLELREHTALRSLSTCSPVRARTIRFRSHEWSNELLAQSDAEQDEDLALLAEAFCIDSRIMLASLAGQDLPADYRALGDLLHAVYRLGGWPCGWVGSRQNGRVQIYRRLARG